MAPSRESQQEAGRFLSRIESDLRQLTRGQQRAQEDGSCWQEVQGILTRLQQHREQIRRLASSKSLDKTVQAKLAAARTKIEEAVRKARELEKRYQMHSPQQISSPRISIMSPRSSAPSLDSTSSAQRCGPSLSSNGTVASAEHEAVELEEVKVLAEQLVVDAAGTDGDMISEFVCKICQTHVVGCQPKLTRCSHLFCGDCISKWFAAQPGCQSWAGRAKGAGTVPCPVCKEPLCADKDLHPVCKGGQGGSAFLWQMLSATRIVCANHRQCNKEGCCDWEGDYGSYQQHIRGCANVPCHAAVLAPTFVSRAKAEVVETWAGETSAGSDVGDHEGIQAVATTFSDTSCTASSSGECEPTMLEMEFETEVASLSLGTPVLSASGGSEDACSIKDSNNSDFMSQTGSSSDQEPDLCSLIAKLVELKASSEHVQPERRPASAGAPVRGEDVAAPQFTQPVLPQDAPLERVAHQDLPPVKSSNKSNGGGKKSAAKSKDAKSKHSHDSLTATQLHVHAAELHALQAQARVAQAAQAAYAAQWQAAWQMQAVQAMRMQQASVAYAERVAQWQSAQKQTVQASWGVQATWAMQTGRH